MSSHAEARRAKRDVLAPQTRQVIYSERSVVHDSGAVGSYPWMTTFLTGARETVAPRRGGRDGLLPPLLVALTVVTGLVDAFSYLVLGHVFVANQTGNVVFFAFALAGIGGFSVAASLGAIGCFALGALAAGRLGRSLAGRRELLLGVTTLVQAVIVAE